jgi:hypothetical protein
METGQMSEVRVTLSPFNAGFWHLGVKLKAEEHINVFTQLFYCTVSDGEIK